MIDFSKIKTYPIAKRKNKEDLSRFPKLEDIADFPANKDLEELSGRINIANRNNKKVILMIGGHVIKTGMSVYLIDLMNRGIINHIAMNGAGSIHDFEIAMLGKTSEDVQAGIYNGSFGMAEETGRIMNNAIKNAAKKNKGYGYAIGKEISDLNFPFKKYSLLYNAFKLNVPATVHVAIGTDIIHQHPSCDGSSIGKTSYNDFKILIDSVSQLKEGVLINLGSAVIMPEVFLKALTISRNLGYDVSNITTANFDMIDHYRPRLNVIERPINALGGRGFLFLGKHQELVPSLYNLLVNRNRK